MRRIRAARFRQMVDAFNLPRPHHGEGGYDLVALQRTVRPLACATCSPAHPENALIRRMPVAECNRALSLSDVSAATLEPRALALTSER
jgi:hypothetical protein